MIPRLHAVTDDRVLGRPDAERRARDVLRAGGPDLALHVRGPGTSGRRIYRISRSLRSAARAAGATLLVNDRADVCRVLELDGVHLGARSLPPGAARRIVGREALIGLSVHGADGAREGDADGADYLFVGTIFSSASHPGREAAGPELLGRAARACGLPLVAIGGLSPGRVREVLDAGAHGVAALSGIWDADRPTEAVKAYRAALEEA